MIRGKEIFKSFEENNVLKGLDINVHKGSIYGLVGENGCGKSTLMKILSGIYDCDEGQAIIDKNLVYENPEIKEKIFYMSEEAYYFYNATVLDMAKFYGGIYKDFSWERFNELESMFKFKKSSRMRSLSKGQKKQAMFWIAFALRPQVFILDEPLDGLDPKIRKKVRELIVGETAEREVTTIISSHNLLELEDLCDHIGIMSGGKIILEKDLDELKRGICKVQYVLKDKERDIFKGVNIGLMKREDKGKMTVDTLKGDIDEIEKILEGENVLFSDVMPLTLEEIFIMELEGEEYEFEKIIVK